MLRYERMEEKHIDGVCKIEKECFPIPWSKASFLKELKNKHAIYFVAVEDDEVVGFGGMWHIINEGNITNIAVDEKHRRKGIATGIIDKLLETACDLDMIGLTLEVRVSNTAARTLYEKIGFRMEGIRKEYYEDNREDALIMWKYFE